MTTEPIAESEARQKICPFMSTMTTRANLDTGNVELPDWWAAFCVGRNCMMWESVTTGTEPHGRCTLKRG